MLGLILFMVAVVYLMLAVFVTRLLVRQAEKRGAARRRRILVGAGALAVFWLIPFWDWIPTVVAHRYYCEKEAGFFVYKAAEQWEEENPSFTERPSGSVPPAYIAHGALTQQLNSRVASRQAVERVFLGVSKHENALIDTKTGEVLVREVYFQSGRCSGAPKRVLDFRFWMIRCRCDSAPLVDPNDMSFREIQKKYENMESIQ